MKAIGTVLIQISPSDNFSTLLSGVRFYQTSGQIMVTASINGLRETKLSLYNLHKNATSFSFKCKMLWEISQFLKQHSLHRHELSQKVWKILVETTYKCLFLSIAVI